MPRRTSRGTAGRASKPPDVSAESAAFRLVVFRDHSRAEMRLKLLRRGYPEAEVDAAEARLAEMGFLDDVKFARMYIRRRSRTRGRLAISGELTAKGIDREIAEAELGRIRPQDQILAANRVARRLAGNTHFASYKELLHSIGVKLLRRGFSMDLARAACANVWDGPEDTSDPLEL